MPTAAFRGLPHSESEVYFVKSITIGLAPSTGPTSDARKVSNHFERFCSPLNRGAILLRCSPSGICAARRSVAISRTTVLVLIWP